MKGREKLFTDDGAVEPQPIPTPDPSPLRKEGREAEGGGTEETRSPGLSAGSGLKPTVSEEQSGSPASDGHIEQVVFDIRGLKARDYYEFKQGMRQQRKLFMRTIVEFPAAWGDPKKEVTYRTMKFSRLVKLRRKLTTQLDATKAVDVPGLAFDVEAITSEEVENLKFETMPERMAKYAVETPEWWDGPVTADTFLDLPYGVYLRAGEMFMEAVNDLGKN